MIEAKVHGTEQLRKRMEIEGLVDEPLVEVLQDAAAIGQKAAVQGVDGGLGIAVRSITRDVKPTQARVFTAMPRARARSIEQGRPSGVSIREILPQLIRWREAGAVGHPDPAIVIAQEIKRRGVKGKHFMQAARDQVRRDLPRLVAQAARRVEENWKK